MEMILWLVWGFGDLEEAFAFQCDSGFCVCEEL